MSPAGTHSAGDSQTEEEIQQLEQQQSDDDVDLFERANPGLTALRDRLKHLQRVAEEIRAKMQG